jgi:hypothetical protein
MGAFLKRNKRLALVIQKVRSRNFANRLLLELYIVMGAELLNQRHLRVRTLLNSCTARLQASGTHCQMHGS